MSGSTIQGLAGDDVDLIEINAGDTAGIWIYPAALDASGAAAGGTTAAGVTAVVNLITLLIGQLGVSDIFYVAPEPDVFEVAPDPAPFIVPPGRLPQC